MWKWEDGKLVAWSDTFNYFSTGKLPAHSDTHLGGLQHEQLAERLKGKILSSILILSDFLDAELWEDPNYCYRDAHVLVSEVEEEARKRVSGDYYSEAQILEFCEKFGLDVESTSYDEKKNREHWIRLENAFIDLRSKLLIPSILKDFKKSFQAVDPDTFDDREPPLTKEQLKILWPDYFLRIMMPRTSRSYRRLYDNIPKPMTHWDSRNSWQQFFFVSDGQGQPIDYIHGGYASSGAREHQGLMAHTFATLDSVSKIKTIVARYSSKNILVPDVEFDSFKTQPQELSGNYRSSREVIRELFRGKLIAIPRNDNLTWGALSEKVDSENAG